MEYWYSRFREEGLSGLDSIARCYTLAVITAFRRRVLASCLLFGLVKVPAHAAQQPLLPPIPDKDPFVGTWRANRDLSRPQLSKRYARYTRTFSRDGDQRISNTIFEGEKSGDRHYRIRCDGQFHPFSAKPNYSMACEYTASNVVRTEGSDPKGHIGYWTEEVSASGQQMIMTIYKDKTRTKIEKTIVLDRIN